MGVTTKTGDDGTTGLRSGERVGKDDLRIECLGSVDELASFLSDARRSLKTARGAEAVDSIQADLFRLAIGLSSREDGAARGGAAGAAGGTGGTGGKTAINEDDIGRLEADVRELEAAVPLKGFVVPGSTDASAKLDICRTVCRRAERRIVALARVESVGAETLRFVNRLSDLLFMLARFEEAAEGAIRYVRKEPS